MNKDKTSTWSFYRENAAWPYVHAALPAAVYVTLRSPLLALLVIYLWESLEFVLTKLRIGNAYFAETTEDSLVGDIIMGSLAIGTLWLLDLIFDWALVFCETVPLLARLVALGALAVSSLIANTDWPDGLLVYAIIYVLTAVILIVPFTQNSPQTQVSIAVWLLGTFVLALIAIVPFPRTSVYQRVFFSLALMFLLVVLILAGDVFLELVGAIH